MRKAAAEKRREIIRHLALKDKEIASMTGIKCRTVENHIQAMFIEYGVEGRLQLVLELLRRGKIKLEDFVLRLN